jgi:hypothetical protein
VRPSKTLVKVLAVAARERTIEEIIGELKLPSGKCPFTKEELIEALHRGLSTYQSELANPKDLTEVHDHKTNELLFKRYILILGRDGVGAFKEKAQGMFSLPPHQLAKKKPLAYAIECCHGLPKH